MPFRDTSSQNFYITRQVLNAKMSTETTSLLPSNASGSSSSYYFLKSEGEGGVNSSVRDADGLEVIETIPEGSTEAEFASRPVVATKVRL